MDDGRRAPVLATAKKAARQGAAGEFRAFSGLCKKNSLKGAAVNKTAFPFAPASIAMISGPRFGAANGEIGENALDCDWRAGA